MSHNKIKVGDATADRAGDVTLNLTSLSDVSGTPTTDQYLKYNGAGWSPVDATTSSEVQFIFIGHGESEDYQYSPHGTGAFTSSSDLYVYDSNHTNTITGSTVTITSGQVDPRSDNWISSVTLPSGNYVVSGQTLLEFSSSGYAVFAFYDSSNVRLSQSGVIGTNRSTYLGAGDLAYSIIELASSTTIKLRLQATGGTIDTGINQGNTPSEHGIIVIEKLS
jgi:hypothetical protein